MSSDAQFHIMENARIANVAFDRHMQTGGAESLYVYFRNKQFGIFADGEDVDRETWTLAFAERAPSHLTRDQLIKWFKTRTDRVPYL